MSKPRYPAKTRVAALDLYLSTNKSLHQIADGVGVKYGTLLTWMRQDGWVKHRQNLEKDLISRTIAEQSDIVAENRGKVMRDQLQRANKLNSALDHVLAKGAVVDDDGKAKTYNAGDLSKLARAFKSTADVEARVVGLDKQSAQAGEITSPQVVQINLAPREIRPVPAPGKTIDLVYDDFPEL